jgi:hypothetical protein
MVTKKTSKKLPKKTAKKAAKKKQFTALHRLRPENRPN